MGILFLKIFSQNSKLSLSRSCLFTDRIIKSFYNHFVSSGMKTSQTVIQRVKEHSEFKENSAFFFLRTENAKPQRQGYSLATLFFFLNATTPDVTTLEFTVRRKGFLRSVLKLYITSGVWDRDFCLLIEGQRSLEK